MAYVDKKSDPAKRRAEVLAMAKMFNQFARVPLAEAENYQLQNFRRLLELAKTANPWWAARLSGINLQSDSISELVAQFDFFSKSDVQNFRDDMLVRIPGSATDDYTWQKTSGSTSQPLQVLKFLPIYFRELDAVAILEFWWQERDIKQKWGFFRLGAGNNDGIPLGPPIEYLGKAPLAFQRSSVDSSPAELVDALAQHQPTYLLTNPVSWRLALQEQISNPRPIHNLQQVLTLADRVDTSLRLLTQEVFGAKIVDRYSAVEFGPIAIQCPVHQHLHVVSPLVYVEILNDQNQPCAIGEPGRVVVTGLRTLAMPIIRYEIGDIAEWGEACDAGINWPVIANVHGRQRTFAFGDDGEARLVTLFGADFMLMPEIIDYQVFKLNDSVVFAAQVRRELDDGEKQRIVASMRDAFRTEVPVHLRLQTTPLRPITWKNQELYLVEANYSAAFSLAEIQGLVKTEHIGNGS